MGNKASLTESQVRATRAHQREDRRSTEAQCSSATQTLKSSLLPLKPGSKTLMEICNVQKRQQLNLKPLQREDRVREAGEESIMRINSQQCSRTGSNQPTGDSQTRPTDQERPHLIAVIHLYRRSDLTSLVVHSASRLHIQ